jgi:hypothetical protein
VRGIVYTKNTPKKARGWKQMLCTREYNREHAVEYAKRWAYERNPLFENYTGFGGDCTNFVSQCIFAGCCVMNFTETFGWYYISPTDRAPAWTGVQYLYNFLVNNTGEGPFAEEVDPEEIQLGDIIMLGNRDGVWYHSVIVTGFAPGSFLVAAHTNDEYNRRLDTYNYYMLRYLHIVGARVEIDGLDDCYLPLLEGRALMTDRLEIFGTAPDDIERDGMQNDTRRPAENGMPAPSRPETPLIELEPQFPIEMRPDATAPDSGMRDDGFGRGERDFIVDGMPPSGGTRGTQSGTRQDSATVASSGSGDGTAPETRVPQNSTVETPEAAMPEDRRAAPPAEPMETPETGMPQEQPPAVPEEGMPQEGAADTPDAAMPEEQAAPDTGMPPETEPDTEHKMLNIDMGPKDITRPVRPPASSPPSEMQPPGPDGVAGDSTGSSPTPDTGSSPGGQSTGRDISGPTAARQLERDTRMPQSGINAAGHRAGETIHGSGKVPQSGSAAATGAKPASTNASQAGKTSGYKDLDSLKSRGWSNRATRGGKK